MVYIYALQLEKGKYYIGKTNNPNFRLENHFNGNGSQWTKIYKPVKVLEIINNCDDYDEDKITRQYMDRYGINNVRGGSFVSVKLKKQMIDILKQMSYGTTNKCFICGKGGHFAKDCDENECWETDSDEDEYHESDSDEEYEEVWVCEICKKEFLEKQKCINHMRYCNSKDCCFRCGREGHYASSCYAVKHIKGYYLK